MISIYEALWQEGQALSESAFIPLRVQHNSSAIWRELRIFVDFYRNGGHLNSEMTGIFSPKFRHKTKVSGAVFLDFAEKQRGADVCMINPFPMLPYYSYNVWMQGEAFHPGLSQRAQALLDAVGIGWDLSLTPRQNHQTLLYSNFWIASPAFWQAYVGEVLNPIACFLEENPESDTARAVLEEASYLVAAPFLPFIVERLFSTFVSLNSRFRIAPYPFDGAAVLDSCLTDFQRCIVAHMMPEVEKADSQGYFSEELIERQHLLCTLSKKYNDIYYSVNRHPHLINVPIAN